MKYARKRVHSLDSFVKADMLAVLALREYPVSKQQIGR